MMKNAGTVINLDIKKMFVLKKQREVTHHAEEESENEYSLITGVNIPEIIIG